MAAWDERMGGGMNGAWSVMNSAEWRVLRRAYAAMMLVLVVSDTANVFSTMHDTIVQGHHIAWQIPTIWESTSGLGFLISAPIVYAATRLAPPTHGGWVRFALVHAPATVIFSVAHVSAMWLARIAIFAARGHRAGRPDFIYEYRKDLFAYLILLGLLWMAREIERRNAPPAANPSAIFEIRDGAKVIRAPVADILAVSSAGNYVEVLLADGRRPLMRSTLAAAEAALGPQGFVRTHRSWLVNADKVRELEAAGSGDFTLRLEGGAEAPLSRRFPEALQRLRGAPMQDHVAAAGGQG